MSKRSLLVPFALIVAGLIGAAVCVMSFPEVEGLGSKVRLPVFHGAMTWVNLAAFTLMGLAAVGSVLTRRPALYRIEEALRWIAVPMWLAGSGMGLFAALQTWDFTGSKASPMEVVSADPRLMAQFWIMLAALGIVAIGLLIDEDVWRSAIDVVFVFFMWMVLMRAVLGPGRALHPDSPVMNSEEIMIKLLFFGMVAFMGLATLAGAWAIVRWRGSRAEKTGDAFQGTAA